MGHPVLRERARPLDKSEIKGAVVQKLIDDMIDTMREYHGVGLAGPQVHEPLRLFVALLDEEPDEKSEATVIINPEIIPNSEAMEEGWEGCLSVPGMRGVVPRYKRLRYRGVDENGRAFEREVSDFHARVVQHEVDHLDGILYPMRIRDFSKFGFNEALFPGEPLPQED